MSHLSRWCGLAFCALAGSLAVGAARAQDDEMRQKVNAAIDKGVAFLKALQSTDGTWQREPNDTPGATALCAYALLESGVRGDDPAIRKAAAAIRKFAVKENKVYHASLDIFFLDKLGDPQDEPLLQALGVRLLAAQNKAWGGWTYFAGMPSVAEQQWLQGILDSRREPAEWREPARPARPRDAAPLPRELQLRVQQVLARPADAGSGDASQGDNSNTQFAMLALWVARRHGIPVEQAMAAVDNRFRHTQWTDGSWDYKAVVAFNNPRGGGNHSVSMTPAGLIGLALGHAQALAKGKNHDLLKDPAVRAGLAHVAKILRGEAGQFDGRIFYFLWTLERMAVIYDLKRIEGIDWYGWGAKYLVDGQAANGSWTGGMYTAGGIDTCFALLFLKRANVAYDLKEIVTKNIIEERPKKKETPFELPLIIPDEGPKKKGDAPKQKPGRTGQSSRAPVAEPAAPAAAPRAAVQACLLGEPLRGRSLSWVGLEGAREGRPGAALRGP
jgi:hypothetical protein